MNKTLCTILISSFAVLSTACEEEETADPSDAGVPMDAPSPADAQLLDVPVMVDAPASANENTWSIDDEVHTGLYESMNCEMNGDFLRLSAAEAGGGLGSIQVVMLGVPTADRVFTAAAPTDLSTLADGQIMVSIGRDRESDNQYKAQSGSVTVTVVTTDPKQINLTFTDLPGLTRAAATANLSGNVGARDGAFIGACSFEDLQ